jgi:hypothetical protein
MFLTTIVSVYGQSEFKEYKGSLVEFQYPIEWESALKEGLNEYGSYVDKDKRVSFEIPNTNGAFTILIEDTDRKNLEELLQEEIESHSNGDMEEILGTKEHILEITDTTLSNEPAKKVIVNVEELDNSLEDSKILTILNLHDNKRYSIVYRMDPASFDHYLPTIEKIIQSFKFTQNY